MTYNIDSIVEELVLHRRGILKTVENVLEKERELAKAFMPQLDASASNEELHSWGKEFLETVDRHVLAADAKMA